jgi:hypothetical protein
MAVSLSPHQHQQQQTASALHRIRFIDQTPSPITAISFAPLPLPTPDQSQAISEKGKGRAAHEEHVEELGILVVGRENGELEIWSWGREDEGGQGNWVLQKVCLLWTPSLCLLTGLDLTTDVNTPYNVTHGIGNSRSYQFPCQKLQGA